MYTQLVDEQNHIFCIQNLETGQYIPQDKRNPAYCAYLHWLALGNQAQQTILSSTNKGSAK
jgi:hypothetical protein